MRKYFGGILLILFTVAMMISCGESEKKPDKETKKVKNDDIEEIANLIPFKAEPKGKWGYIDLDGKIVIDTIFENMPSYFKEGFALVKTGEDEYDYIDEEGKRQNKKYASVTLFFDGMACVSEKGKAPTYINTKFEELFSVEDAMISGVFSEGFARFSTKDQKWGFINNKGEVVIKPVYDNVMSFSEGMALVAEKDGDKAKFGFINTEGKEVIPLNDKVDLYQPFTEGLAAYHNENGWGFIDKEGNIVIEATPDREYVAMFKDGEASFQEGGDWGVMDKEGNKIVLPKYELPVEFHNGLAVMKDGDRYGYINHAEEQVIEPGFKLAVRFLGKHSFIKYGKFYYLIDMEGNLLDMPVPVRDINPYLNDLEDKTKYAESKLPKMVKELDKIKKELKEKQEEMMAAQQNQQAGNMQMQQPVQMQQPSAKDLVRELASNYEKILSGKDMDVMAQQMAAIQYQLNMLLSSKQADKKFMKEFETEYTKRIPSIEVKYKDVMDKLQQHVMKETTGCNEQTEQ